MTPSHPLPLSTHFFRFGRGYDTENLSKTVFIIRSSFVVPHNRHVIRIMVQFAHTEWKRPSYDMSNN